MTKDKMLKVSGGVARFSTWRDNEDRQRNSRRELKKNIKNFIKKVTKNYGEN